MLFIYILPSVGSCTTCLRTKFHHYFQITLVYFTTKCKQVTNTLLPSHTCYPHFLLRVWGSITPYMFSLLKRGFLIWLPSGTDTELQVTQSIYHFDVTLKIAFQNRSYQMSVYDCFAIKELYQKSNSIALILPSWIISCNQKLGFGLAPLYSRYVRCFLRKY